MLNSRRRRGGRITGDILSGAAEATNVSFNLPGGTFPVMNIFTSDLGTASYQTFIGQFFDETTVNGGSFQFEDGVSAYTVWFNQGRELVQGNIGVSDPVYGLFDYTQDGILDIWSASSDATYFEGIYNDGLGNFASSGVYYTGMDSFGAPLQFHIRQIGGSAFLRATLDGSDIYDCEIFTDGTVGSFAFVASSGYAHIAPVLSGNLDGSGGSDSIDSFDPTHNIFKLHLTRYGTAGVSDPGGNSIEIGWRNTDTIDQLANRVVVALTGFPFSIFKNATAEFTITAAAPGTLPDPTNGMGTSMDFNVGSYGTSANINPGDWIYIQAPYVNGTQVTFAFYFVVDGNGGGPGIADYENGISVASGSDFNTVGAAIADSINGISFDSILGAAWVPGAYCALTFGFVGPGDFSSSNGSVSADIGSGGSVQQYSGAILFNTPSTNYYAWFPMGSWNSNPSIAGRTGVSVSASPGATAATIATAFKTAMNAVAAKAYTVTDVSSTVKRVTNNATGAVTDASKTIGSAVTITVSTQGS